MGCVFFFVSHKPTLLSPPQGAKAWPRPVSPRPALGGVEGRAFHIGLDQMDRASALEQPGSALLRHAELSTGLRSCLAYRWLNPRGAFEALGDKSLSDIGVGRVLAPLSPRLSYAVRQGLLFGLLRKDARLLASAVALLLEETHFKRHKSLLFLLDKLLYGGAPLLSRVFGIRGLKIKVKGKIGVGGNSKKRRVSVDTQGCGYSRKRTRFSLSFKTARTVVGVLGVLVIVAS